MISTPQEFELALNHICLRGLKFGLPEKPVVLALHGWLDNANSFAPLAAILPDYHIIALEFAGHGKSDHRSVDAHYHLTDNVQDLHEVIQILGLSDVLLLGHSMGGIVASMYAASFPQQVAKLIVMESFGPLTMAAESSPEQLKKSIESRIAIEHKAVKHPDTLEKAVTARLMAGKMAASSARLLMERNIDTAGNKLRWRTDPRLRTISSLRLTEPQANAFLQQINCPWLTILGESGFEKLKVNFHKRKDNVQNLSFKSCKGGHHLHMDHPEDVASEIVQFF